MTLDTFQADALDTANSLKELAVHLEVKELNGGAAICKRAAALIREMVLREDELYWGEGRA